MSPLACVRQSAPQHVHETVLLEQCSVVAPGRIVKDLLVGTEVHVVDFAGREVGPVGD